MSQNTAEVIAVSPDKIRIAVDSLDDFKLPNEKLKVGSYLEIGSDDTQSLIAIIESFSIELKEITDSETKERDVKRVYIIDAQPLGMVNDNKFVRGGDEIAIPPTGVNPASFETIKSIFESSVEKNNEFTFASLALQPTISVPVDGNKFFNKHIAIVGSTGSGKSHSVARMVQNAVAAKSNDSIPLNNSHIIIFDIHSEYAAAFPNANTISIDELALPYWLFNSEELEELFLESGDNNNYNQASLLRTIITLNKTKHNPKAQKVFFDSPLRFNIFEVLNCLENLSIEVQSSSDRLIIPTKTDSGEATCKFESEDALYTAYFKKNYPFALKKSGYRQGSYADGKINKFISRFKTKLYNDRLNFLFGNRSESLSFSETLIQLLGYNKDNENNVTIIDLSGVPFEVLSITVSLISRLLFEYGYYYKKQNGEAKTPLLLVYEEVHKYAPKSDLARYKSSQKAIETIAKEGRKYGVSLLIATQRPSEVSETIFSQCSNFLAMRLTNPDDQRYVKRLLPDTLGSITDSLPSLRAGEGILIGDAVVIPSVVKVGKCSPAPSSSDIAYLEEWKKKWVDVDFETVTKKWNK